MDEPDGATGWSRSCLTPGDVGAARASTNNAQDANEPPGDSPAFASLMRAIETEIIPRLMLAHRPRTVPSTGRGSAEWAGEAEVIEFTELLLASDGEAATAYVRSKQRSGIDVDALFLKLFSAAARRLGELWVEDLCSFTEVTVGVSRLHALVRELSPAFHHGAGEGARGDRRALLVPTPGEQHNFGLFMLSEFFRRDGWDVCGDPAPRAEDLVRKVSDQKFDLVGLSLSGERLVESLRETIREMRKSSCNGNLVVIVGGALFISQPELVEKVGADATAADAPQALARANALVRAAGMARQVA